MSRNGFPMTPRRGARWSSHPRPHGNRAGPEVDPADSAATLGDHGSLNAPYPSISPPPPPRSPDTVSSNSTIREHTVVKQPQLPLPQLHQEPPQPPPVFARTCTITVNESFARDEILVNLDHFDDSVQVGQLMAIDILPDQRAGYSSLRRGTGRKDDGTSGTPSAIDGAATTLASAATAAAAEAGGDNPVEVDANRRYLFIVKDMPKELKARHPLVELYVAKRVADAFGMKKGSTVMLTVVDANNPAVEASHVEIHFKDQYLSRADMWRMAVTELAEKTIYRGQMVLFMNTIKAQVTTVYVEGKPVQSAFYGKNTRPIFRSESARYVLFIQMAREMWDFDSDGSGEIIFSKVVNGFLPTLFKKWQAKKVKHLVTIVLFARVEYDTGLAFDLDETTVQHDYYTGIQSSGNRRPYKDFYRVVVSDMASGEWTRILYQLKREFNLFRRDISLHHLDNLRPDTSASIPDEAGKKAPLQAKQQHHIQAESSLAMYGNVLEAINMASSLFAHDYVDRDLVHTGISVGVITPGSGVFEVEYDTLRRTNEAWIGNGMGIDLICVPKMPLHSAPLFRFRHPRYFEKGLGKSRSFYSQGQGNSQGNRSGSNEGSLGRSLGSFGHEGSLSRSYGISSSTPKQPAPIIGSYSSLGGGSLSPSKATDATIRGYESMSSDRFNDSWSYALPQWLHVSYWASDPDETLFRQGVPPPPLANTSFNSTRGGRHDEFTVRCRMYDLQMRGVLETNEIETTPLHVDPLFPKKAFQASTSASSEVKLPPSTAGDGGFVVIRSKLVANVLFDQVHGFQRFSPDKIAKQDNNSLWKQLQLYDAGRQKLPTRRYNLHAIAAHQRREQLDDKTSGTTITGPSTLRRQHLLGHPDVSPYSERRPSMSGRLLAAAAIPTGKLTTGVDAPTRRTMESKAARDRRAPSFDRQSIASSRSTASRMPKAMRQISLGQRGFGIAAPKAVIAEVKAETVAASRLANPTVHASIQTAMAPSSTHLHLPSTPKSSAVSSVTATPSSPFSSSTAAFPSTDKARPGTSSSAVLGSTTSSLSAVTVGGPIREISSPSRPIVIKSTQGPAAGVIERVAGSFLPSAGVPERTEISAEDRDVRYSNALRAEDAQRVYNSKLLAEAVPEPKALSPTAAFAPWMIMVNPSKPEARKIDSATFNSRWYHVFPQPSRQRAMKWKSLCSPASVPLTTEYFPSRTQFESEYEQQPYSVSREIDDDLPEVPQAREDLLRELINLRFSQGFQVVIGPAVAKAFGQKQVKTAEIFYPNYTIEDGTSIFMTMGNTIHQLSCANSSVEVNIFHRKTAEAVGSSTSSIPHYRPAIRTLLDRDYETSEIDIITPRPERNWNYIDAYLAGHDDELTENLRFWRARFVLIPMSSKTAIPKSGDSDEEVRIEGIRKLGQMWQKYRIIPPSERRFQSFRKLKDTNPLDVVYKTEDPSVVIAAELETLPLFDGLDVTARKGQLVTNREQFRKSNLNLAALAEAIQQPVESGGVRMQNRRWHLRLHYNCFIGSDMTSWLLDNFEDLDSREEAEALGNMLMVSTDGTDTYKEKPKEADESTKDGSQQEKSGRERDREASNASVSSGIGGTGGTGGTSGTGGSTGGSNNGSSGDAAKEAKRSEQGIFIHVEKRHNFRDGQYFYQISSEFAKPLPHTAGWFNTSRRRDTSVPSTPLPEPQRDGSSTVRSTLAARPPATAAIPAAMSTYMDDSATTNSGSTTPTAPTAAGGTTAGNGALGGSTTTSTKRPRVILSKCMKYDVDARKRSYRPERVDLHYERLHNPDNCYHIRLEWMNVTAKLIEDAVEMWSREAHQFGLKLVEVPIAEAISISEVNPFRRPYQIRLARPPPLSRPFDPLGRPFDASLGPSIGRAFDPTLPLPPLPAQPGRHVYQKAILRKFGFVLDVEAASNFPANVDVIYSWGKPNFKYTQYIHRSGVVLAQITGDGDFLLLANRLYSHRVLAAVGSREREKGDYQNQTPQSSTIQAPSTQVAALTPSTAMPYGLPENTPVHSPILRATNTNSPHLYALGGPADTPSGKSMVGDGLAGSRGGTSTGPPAVGGTATAAAAATLAAGEDDPEAIKDELEAFCLDEAALDAFYAEVQGRQVGGPGVSTGSGAIAGIARSGTPGSISGTPTLAPAAAAAAATAAVPDISIPALGLPPALLSSSVLASAANTSSNSGRVHTIMNTENGGPSGSPAPSASSAQTGSPATLASRLLRQGSVDDSPK